MQPPLVPVLLLVLLAVAALSAHAFVLPAASCRSRSSLATQQQRRRQQQAWGPAAAVVKTMAAAASDTEWPSDSSDMEDTSEEAAAAAAGGGPVVDVEARKATIQVRAGSIVRCPEHGRLLVPQLFGRLIRFDSMRVHPD